MEGLKPGEARLSPREGLSLGLEMRWGLCLSSRGGAGRFPRLILGGLDGL